MIFLSRFGTMPISCGLVPFLSFHQPMGKGLEFVTLCYYGIVHCALCLVRGPTTWSLSHCLYIALVNVILDSSNMQFNTLIHSLVTTHINNFGF